MPSTLSNRFLVNNMQQLLKYSCITCIMFAAFAITKFVMIESATRNAVYCVRDAGGIVETLDQVKAFGYRFDTNATELGLSEDPYCFAIAYWAVVKVSKRAFGNPDIQSAIHQIHPKKVILVDEDSRYTAEVLEAIAESLGEGTPSPPIFPIDASEI